MTVVVQRVVIAKMMVERTVDLWLLLLDLV